MTMSRALGPRPRPRPGPRAKAKARQSVRPKPPGPPKLVISVNRADFIAWTEGELFQRDAQGRCLVGDHEDHERAQCILDTGGVVGLLVEGRLVSTIRLTEAGYVETLGGEERST